MPLSVFSPSPNCQDIQEPDLLSIEQALARMMAVLPVHSHTEQISLSHSLGRVIAEAIISPLDVPAHTNSAMDGYAVHSADLPATGMQTWRIVGRAWAGKPFVGEVQRGECVRIMTGAMLPDGTDTVIIQERAYVDGETMQAMAGEQAGQNVRAAGEDLRHGEVVLAAGRVITPADMGLLASLGISELRVKTKIRVAFFSTGDEICSLGEFPQLGQVFDSNRYTLRGMLQIVGVELVDMGVVRDDPVALRAAFLQAQATADVLITSGGVSVGEADFTKAILAELGSVQFWKLAIKPGRPLAFGMIDKLLFFGLPGNPVAVMVTFYQLVQPMLQYLVRGSVEMPLIFMARSLSSFRKKVGRAEFARGVLSKDGAGEWTVEKAGDQGSGILRSMSVANCFVLLASEQGNVAVGDWVKVQPFRALI